MVSSVTEKPSLVQNPNNKREVLCNDILRNLTGQDKVLAFGAQKYFSHHIFKS